MSTDFTNLPYRPCVGIMLVNAAGQAFVGRRIDTRGQPDEGGVYWQMPQGGIDDGEDLHAEWRLGAPGRVGERIFR